jgi:hypothetical protein
MKLRMGRGWVCLFSADVHLSPWFRSCLAGFFAVKFLLFFFSMLNMLEANPYILFTNKKGRESQAPSPKEKSIKNLWTCETHDSSFNCFRGDLLRLCKYAIFPRTLSMDFAFTSTFACRSFYCCDFLFPSVLLYLQLDFLYKEDLPHSITYFLDIVWMHR